MCALILDDDPWSLRLLSLELETAFPKLKVQQRTEPDASGTYDIYFIDNRFDGKPLAAALVAQVRAERPHALIVVFAATLTRADLKALVNAGCDGVCEKGNADDLATLIELTGRYLSDLALERQPRPSGLVGAVRSARLLLEQWNQRLEHETQRLRVGS